MNDVASTAPRCRPTQASLPRCLVRFNEIPRPTLRLFCFPYAGGNANLFRGWDTMLDAGIEVIGVQLPGRSLRWKEAPAVDFGLLAEELTDAIQAAAGPVRFGFFGHSMGALLMFEVSRQLQTRGLRLPECLFASGRPAPHLPPSRVRAPMTHDAEFIDELRRLEGTPAEVLDNPELLAMLMPSIRGDFALLDSWRFEPSSALDVPLFALAGRSDPHVSVDAAAAWAQWTQCSFELMTYPGGHFFLHDHERRLVRDISDRLAGMLNG